MKKLKKSIYALVGMLVVYAIVSCSADSISKSSHGFELKILVEKEKYCLDEDINIQVVLTNTSKNNILVDETWSLLPGYWPPEMSTGYLVILDSSGNPLPVYSKLSVPPVAEGDFSVFMPKQALEKNIIIRNIKRAEPYTYGYPFQVGETYTVSVTYQNVLTTSKDLDGRNVNSWTGKISASDTFQIISKDCKD